MISDVWDKKHNVGSMISNAGLPLIGSHTVIVLYYQFSINSVRLRRGTVFT